ncbi:MAG TPA: type I secretion C-terminal target domain-containing protein [Tepidisphaeraceae bacterium]|nr:type I secretion C-terminal target domain-containing protein [Tepidisphaeraceae bacterium]
MAESNNTTEGGTPLPTESAESATPAAESSVKDLIVESVLDGAPLARADEDATDGAAQAAAARSGFSAVSDADMLHLADLLQGEHDGNLDAYLKFTSDGTNTTVHVSTSGEVNWHETEIILQGVGDLTAGGMRSASTIIADLLAHGTLITDV